jgi:hypothetical protein
MYVDRHVDKRNEFHSLQRSGGKAYNTQITAGFSSSEGAIGRGVVDTTYNCDEWELTKGVGDEEHPSYFLPDPHHPFRHGEMPQPSRHSTHMNGPSVPA